MAAPRHHRPRRGQALHAPVQLPAVLHGRDRPHGRSEAPRDRPRRAGRARADPGASQRRRVPLRHPRGVRGPRVERLVVHGLHLRFDAGSHRRHGLQGVRHGEGHHRPADGQQGPRPVGRHPRSCAQAGQRRSRLHPRRHAGDHRRAARGALRVRTAHRDHPHPGGQDPRRHRLGRQGRPRHPGGDGRQHQHRGGRHHPHRRHRGPGRRGREGHDSRHRQGARGGRDVRR